VSQSKYDELSAQNQQLQQQVAAEKAHVSRLQGAIKYTVNSDLLFPSGSWQMSVDGKEVIARMAKTLAADQQEKLLVNGYTDNASIGPELKRQGVTTNQALSQKRAETVMQYMVSQGVKPNLVAAQGFGDAQPVASNSTPQGRAQNRRVEITLARTGS
jgi:chemotaxis protein MotB